MKLFTLLSIVTSCLNISVSQVIDEYMKREHSLVKPYQGAGASIPHWDFLGNTVITNNHIRLTGEIRSQQGAIWNRIPCWARHWEVQIHFKVHGKDNKLFGDGFSFWYVKEPMQLGGIFGSKDYFTGLAVLVDTYNNHNGAHKHDHPYISAMINNGTLHYDHDRDGTHTQLAGCVAKFRNLDYDTYFSIKYYQDTLTVSIDIKNSRISDPCFTVDGVYLPTGYYFGVSAATGDLFDAHDIISFRMFDLTSADDDLTIDRSNIEPKASHFDAPRDHVDDPQPSSMSTWKKILLIFFGVTVICGSVVIGGLLYSRQQEQKRKRFY